MTSRLMRRARYAIAAVLDRVSVRLVPTERVGGPYPVYVRRTGLGAEIRVDELAEALLFALMTEVSEDPTGVADEAAYLVQTDGPERDRLLEDLLKRLGGASISLNAASARKLADRLNMAAGPVPFIPRQQGREAA